MDESESLGDAEMRFVTVNGQTVMLEGDLGNMCVTNELLNEMLLIGGGKDDGGSQDCGIDLSGNPCGNGLRSGSDDPTKIELTIQGENNELQTIHIGMDEAKELGLYIYGIKNEGIAEWNQSCNGGMESQEQVSVVSINNVKEAGVGAQTETVNKNKLESMPLLDGDSCNKDQSMLLPQAESVKGNLTNGQVNGIQFTSCSNTNQKADVQEENSSDNFPAIGHLEGFQIPTADDGTLLPATVNAKMADGSYQMLTLIPQVVDGNVTYSVQFANLDSDETDSKTFSHNDSVDSHIEEYNMNNLCNGVEERDIKKSKRSVVEEFLKSVQFKKNVKVKNASVDNIGIPVSVGTDSSKNTPVNFVNLAVEQQNILKLNNSNNFTVPDNFNFDNLSVNYIQQSPMHQTPIEAKIDNLISENENVIAKCKKVKYGKKIRQADMSETNEILQNIDNVSKGALGRAKKVKFKSRKGLDDEMDGSKKMKLSLLKPNNDQVQEGKSDEALQNGVDADGSSANANKNMISHVNLNCRLEYPNLKAIDESASLPYLKVKSHTSPKQPYFNVLPYPKDKTMPQQRQYLPLSCDLQQAKNLISLQKFLETQKLQLKIQPLNSVGSKMVNIRPKPTVNEQLKTLQDLGFGAPVATEGILASSGSFLPAAQTQQQQTATSGSEAKKTFADVDEKCQGKSAKDLILGDGKVNTLNFIAANGEQNIGKGSGVVSGGAVGSGTGDRDSSSDFDGKINGIFIKNNPEYFQKSKDGKAEEHPLGSSENPIQLVQTGHTFHSRQPLSETQLRQIASILQKQKFDSQNIKKNSIFDPKTNTRIVYRVVYPDDVEAKRSDENAGENSIKKKRGRHRTKPAPGEDDIHKPLSKGPRRPKKLAVASMEEDVLEEEVEDPQVEQKKIPRTRSGRLSRPPRYMVKDYKRLHNSDVSEKNSNSNYESDEAYSDYVNDKELTKERVNKLDELETNLLPGLRSPTRSKRNFKPEYRCPTCHKIYLGHSRMMWHLNKFPDHCNAEKYKEIYSRKPVETKVRRAARRFNMCDVSSNVKQVLSSMSKDELTSLCGPLLAEALTTWDFLLLRVNLLKEEMKGEVDALLHELAVLLEKLTKMAEDIFLPVFTKEGEKDEDCVEIDRMEIAIALGLPIGFYKINNDNLNLLKLPVKKSSFEPRDDYQRTASGEVDVVKAAVTDDSKVFLSAEDAKPMPPPPPLPEPEDDTKKMDDDFWMSEKTNESGSWTTQQTDDGGDSTSATTVKALATKFEPNLSTKLMDSSNDSIDDVKYEEPMMDLETNLKDVEQSDSSGNLDRSPPAGEAVKDNSEGADGKDVKDASMTCPQLWSDKSADKRELWSEGENPGEKVVDESNSEFLDTFLGVGNLGSGGPTFLADNMSLMSDDNKGGKAEVVADNGKSGGGSGEERSENFIRMWDGGGNSNSNSSDKNQWTKEEADLLSGSIHERMPGLRTANRLTSTPETNGNMSFTIPNRRNSISDFSNINLEPAGLDMVLPPAKTLIKERTKTVTSTTATDTEGFPMKTDFSTSNVNSEDLMKIALESLTSHSDVIAVPPASFDSAMGILNPSTEAGNLNLFTSSEADGLDFNLPLPEHLLRPSGGFPSCTSNNVSPTFLSTTSNLFGGTTSAPMEQFYPSGKKVDDVMEFFEAKHPYTSYETCMDGSVTNFSFVSTSSSHNDQYSVTQCLNDSIVSAFVKDESSSASQPSQISPGQPQREALQPAESSSSSSSSSGEVTAGRAAASSSTSMTPRSKKPSKLRKGMVRAKAKKLKSSSGRAGKKRIDYPKTNSIESIINEALFDSCSATCPPNGKSMKIDSNSSPNGTSTIPNGTDNYASLPIIPESLDEVGNLDFLNQD